jgi:hypothetical protein
VTNPRLLSPELLSTIEGALKYVDEVYLNILLNIYCLLRGIFRKQPAIPKGFVPERAYEQNITRESASEFLDLAKGQQGRRTGRT